MKNSSHHVPFVIILALVLIFAVVFLLNSTSPDVLRQYDVLGIGNLRQAVNSFNSPAGNSESPETADSSSSETFDVESEQTDEESLDDEEAFDGDESYDDEEVYNGEEPYDGIASSPEESTADTASDASENVISPNMSYMVSADLNVEDLKLTLPTTSLSCDYRIHVKSTASENYFKGTLKITLYDSRGMMVGEPYFFQPYYANSPSYKDEFTQDILLEKDNNYTIKLSGDNSSGEFQFTVLTLDRDAGYSQETATPLNVGEELTATLNSTISDWYVCDISEPGRYEFTFHNINTGDRAYATVTSNSGSLASSSIKNEDNFTGHFNIANPRKVHIEVKPNSEAANGTYIMIINKCEH